MTFGPGRRLMNGCSQYEMYRFCNKLNTIVVGAASKLLKYFISKHQPNEIVSFSSNDISGGNVYNTLGFKQGCDTNSYWYINTKNMNRYHRYKFRKSELNKIGVSEDSDPDFYKKTNCLKIFDSGQTKFILNIK